MTADITLASNSGDAAVLETITQYHAALLGAGSTKTTAFLAAAAGHTGAASARDELVTWSQSTLRPYLQAEADVLMPALQQTGDGSTASLTAGSTELLTGLDRLAAAHRAADVGAAAAALHITLAEHFRLLAEKSLPALAQASGASLAALWDKIESATGAVQSLDADERSAGAGHVCACGVLDDEELPELDVRTVPHAIRHATVFGALEAVDVGSGLVLVAHHDPLPLLAQIEQRSPAAFDVHYLERGPDAWKLQFRRIGGTR
ncbi:MAG TPA: DUF2249 domain-containing protein [Arthrobacter sp.]|nr:DUF2249 domain-containing protein [Arthrobacter sp.]